MITRVNFKKLRPRVSILKGSKVLEELQNIATAEPKQVRELKRTSTFLQKPQRPVPKSKREEKVEEDDGEIYKVVIKKQDKKTVIARLVEKGLLPPGSEVTFTKTPEPSEPSEFSEVKMHETENSPENRLLLVSDSNSSCSISPFDSINDAISFSYCSKFESSEKTLLENQPARCASYKCKLFYAKPSHYRKYSCTGKYNDTKIKSSVKGYYLENILRGCIRSCAPRYQQIDNQLDEIVKTKGDACLKNYDWLKNIGFDDLLSNEKKKITRRCARAHYAERIFLQNVNTVARHLRSMSKTTRISRTNRCRTKGRYITTYLERESVRLMSLITMLFQFLLQKPDVSESMNMLKVRKQHMSYKGRYFEHVFQKNVTFVIQTVKETSSVGKQKDGPKSNRTKGRYLEKYLYRQNLRFRFALTNFFYYIKSSLDNIFSIDTLSKVRRRKLRGRYFERFVHRNVKIFELFADYVCSRISEWFEKAPSCTSRKEFPVITLGASNYNNIVDDSVLNKVNEDVRDKKIFDLYEDDPSCSSPKESFAVVSIDNSIFNEEKIDKNDRNISEEVKLPKPTDALAENNDIVSKFLQSAKDYISSEVFHRGNRRLSRSRKSINIVPKEDDNAFSRFLQSTEDYISTEVFHRGSKRLSKSRKSIDIFSKENDKAVSKLLHSAEDYISTEVFHRGSRRLSKSSGKESISLAALTLWDGLKSVHFNLPWFSLRIIDKSATKYDKICDKKIDADIEFDNRRLSFVPTILYKGITNRIGVDFTRLMAYAFVPCTSFILLYMYR